MNSVALILRRSASANRFRAAILGALRCPAIDQALLCSGFFQSDQSYCAGSDLTIMSYRAGSPITLTVVGHYGYGWKAQYVHFFAALVANNAGPGFSAVRLRVPRYRWHAKVFIGKQGVLPKIAIVGSSNMTRPAFTTSVPFNNECDVILWDQNDSVVDTFVNAAIVEPFDANDVIVARVDETHRTFGQGAASKVVNLEQEILELAFPF